jgi:putative tryptophan/tyrosine transport system substrate-binding protein
MRLHAVGLVVTLACAFLVVPLATDAQQPTKAARIGVLSAARGGLSPGPSPTFEAFRQGLRALGYVEGQNIAIESRNAEGQVERLPALAAELVRLPVDVIVTTGENAARAAQHATRTIPIVIAAGADPVEAGLVASLARPGGNLTGLSLLSPELGGKRLELLKEAVPLASRVGVLFNPASRGDVHQWRETEGAARALGVQLHALEVRRAEEFERAFATAASAGVGALVVFRNFLNATHRTQILQLAAQRRLPVMSTLREFVDDGGLMSYGPSLSDSFRRAATYVDKILKGAKPADLPIEQPTKFELILNRKTAQALRITFPPTLLILADEVIQ